MKHKYSPNKMWHIPKHKKARLRKNRRGFRKYEFDMAWLKLIKEGYDLPPISAR